MPGRLASKKIACAILFSLLAASLAYAGTLSVEIRDAQGAPLPQIAVHARRAASLPAAAVRAPVPRAIMDQQGQQFVPHILIVETGTEVLFPNSDPISHHVYSFSEPKTFELGLYKGNVYPPLVFDRPGVVVLGCNIHDGMLGYILVVDTPHFALTDASGVAHLVGLTPGQYWVEVWTPRARPSALPSRVRVELAGDTQSLALRFEERLTPPHHLPGSSLSWDHY